MSGTAKPPKRVGYRRTLGNAHRARCPTVAREELRMSGTSNPARRVGYRWALGNAPAMHISARELLQ